MDVLKALKQMPDESVDMQITSPPYWALRDYGEGTEHIWDGDKDCEHKWGKEIKNVGHRKNDGLGKSTLGLSKATINQQEAKQSGGNFCPKCGAWKGQLGLEPTFDLYIKHLCDIFDEVKRVLKKDGTCWVNLGDTYSGTGNPDPSYKGFGEGIEGKKQLSNVVPMGDKKPDWKKLNYKDKCLCCVPERFMIEMINRGWILRNKIIWHKPNHMPTSVKDRFANSWEYVFMFSKSQKYYFDLDAVREPHKEISIKRLFAEDHLDKRKIDTTGMLSISPESQIKSNIKRRQEYLEGDMKGKNPDDVVKFDNETSLVKGVGVSSMSARLRKDGKKYIPREDGKNPGDTIITKSEHLQYSTSNIHSRPECYRHPDGKNPSDFWDITTHGYKEAHFAVFPEALVKRPIKTTPQWICNKCGKARERIIEQEGYRTPEEEAKLKELIKERGIPRQTAGILVRSHTTKKDLGWTDCGCNAGFRPAVIMDIFTGSGTTLKVARDLGRDSIGIEIKKEYCDLIYKRLFAGSHTLFPDEFKLIK